METQKIKKQIIVRNFSLEILKLSPTECLLFSYIFEHKSIGCSDTLDTFAANFNVSKVTVIKTLKFLVDSNFIIKKRNGQTVTYWAHLENISRLQKEFLLNPKNDNVKVKMFDDGDFDSFLYTDITKSF